MKFDSTRGGIPLPLKRLSDSSVSSLTSGRTSGHQNLIPTFPWIDNCLKVTKRLRLWLPNLRCWEEAVHTLDKSWKK